MTSMSINPTNDVLQVFADLDGLWRWRRVDGSNGRVLCGASEGYVNQSYAEQAAVAYSAPYKRLETVAEDLDGA